MTSRTVGSVVNPPGEVMKWTVEIGASVLHTTPVSPLAQCFQTSSNKGSCGSSLMCVGSLARSMFCQAGHWSTVTPSDVGWHAETIAALITSTEASLTMSTPRPLADRNNIPVDGQCPLPTPSRTSLRPLWHQGGKGPTAPRREAPRRSRAAICDTVCGPRSGARPRTSRRGCGRRGPGGRPRGRRGSR